MKQPTLTPEQLRALQLYAAENGRLWKHALRIDWELSSAHVKGEFTAELQQVRNIFGPKWLARFKLPAAAAEATPCAS